MYYYNNSYYNNKIAINIFNNRFLNLGTKKFFK